MKNLPLSKVKAFTTAAVLGMLAPVAVSQRPANSQSMDVCPTNATLAGIQTAARNGCRTTPNLYQITVYRFALCTSEPFTSSGLSSSCVTTFTDTSGRSATLYASGAPLSVTMPSSIAPPPGTYKYAAILMGNNMTLNSSYATSDSGTIYSTSTYGTVKQTSPAQDYVRTMNYFGGGPATSCSAEETMSLGTMKAFILDSSLRPITISGGTCPGAARIAARMEMNTPIKITSKTSALIATFTVTNNGSTISCPGSCIARDLIEFDSGPFQVSFTTIE